MIFLGEPPGQSKMYLEDILITFILVPVGPDGEGDGPYQELGATAGF